MYVAVDYTWKQYFNESNKGIVGWEWNGKTMYI